ncbi:MAG: UDP-3-O-(3-hydroxymyristoyl)glucosamine N-acyltransferase [Pseudomonadota bacterium]
MKSFSLKELADLVGGESSECPGPAISGVRPVEFASPSDITYVINERFLEQLGGSAAGAAFVPHGLKPGRMPWIRVNNPEVAFARTTALFYSYARPDGGISPKAEVHPRAVTAEGAVIGPYAVIDRGAEIGARAVIGAHVVIGEDSRVGADSWIFPNVTVYARVTIGERVIIHSGSVIGADGFGFAAEVDERGRPSIIKKYHSGSVEIGDDCEIGANCAVDRALAGSTKLGRAVKLDNFVQVAHNVHIGDGTVIAAQVGIAGSSSLGAFCRVAGQVGITDHVAVGQGVTLATRAGVYRDVADNAVLGGAMPAMPYNVFLRVQSMIKRLPDMFDRIRKLERFVHSNQKD